MGNRATFHEQLVTILGTRHVYFQPPATIKLTYPCIVYKLSDIEKTKADNTCYKYDKKYKVTFITRSADSDEILEKLLKLPYSSFVSQTFYDGLYNNTFEIYY